MKVISRRRNGERFIVFVFVFVLGALTVASRVVDAQSSPSAPNVLRYTILSNGKVAGNEMDSYGPGGRIDCTFEFNDRGRGPKISAQYVIGENGLPSRTDVTGNDYLKAPVDEHFAIEAGVARWKSLSEEGQASTSGFYISSNGPAAESAFLVQALLKAKGAPVKLFPGGEARLAREQISSTAIVL